MLGKNKYWWHSKRGGIFEIYSIRTNSALKVGLVPMETTIRSLKLLNFELLDLSFFQQVCLIVCLNYRSWMMWMRLYKKRQGMSNGQHKHNKAQTDHNSYNTRYNRDNTRKGEKGWLRQQKHASISKNKQWYHCRKWQSFKILFVYYIQILIIILCQSHWCLSIFKGKTVQGSLLATY